MKIARNPVNDNRPGQPVDRSAISRRSRLPSNFVTNPIKVFPCIYSRNRIRHFRLLSPRDKNHRQEQRKKMKVTEGNRSVATTLTGTRRRSIASPIKLPVEFNRFSYTTCARSPNENPTRLPVRKSRCRNIPIIVTAEYDYVHILT